MGQSASSSPSIDMEYWLQNAPSELQFHVITGCLEYVFFFSKFKDFSELFDVYIESAFQHLTKVKLQTALGLIGEPDLSSFVRNYYSSFYDIDVFQERNRFTRKTTTKLNPNKLPNIFLTTLHESLRKVDALQVKTTNKGTITDPIEHETPIVSTKSPVSSPTRRSPKLQSPLPDILGGHRVASPARQEENLVIPDDGKKIIAVECIPQCAEPDVKPYTLETLVPDQQTPTPTCVELGQEAKEGSTEKENDARLLLTRQSSLESGEIPAFGAVSPSFSDGVNLVEDEDEENDFLVGKIGRKCWTLMESVEPCNRSSMVYSFNKENRCTNFPKASAVNMAIAKHYSVNVFPMQPDTLRLIAKWSYNYPCFAQMILFFKYILPIVEKITADNSEQFTMDHYVQVVEHVIKQEKYFLPIKSYLLDCDEMKAQQFLYRDYSDKKNQIIRIHPCVADVQLMPLAPGLQSNLTHLLLMRGPTPLDQISTYIGIAKESNILTTLNSRPDLYVLIPDDRANVDGRDLLLTKSNLVMSINPGVSPYMIIYNCDLRYVPHADDESLKMYGRSLISR